MEKSHVQRVALTRGWTAVTFGCMDAPAAPLSRSKSALSDSCMVWSEKCDGSEYQQS